MINAAIFLENTIVPHKAYQNAVNRLDYFIKSAEGGMEEPVGFAFLGEPRAGKSLVIKTLAVRYPKDHDKNGLRLPFLSVTLPSKPTIKGLGEEMLKEFDPTDDRRYTEVQLTRRLRALMKNCGTLVLALDEFQHFYDKRKSHPQRFRCCLQNYLYSEEELKNVAIRPFTPEFNGTPSVAALQDAAKVGAASVEEVKTRSSLGLNKGGDAIAAR